MDNDSSKEELSVLQVIQDIKNGLQRFTDLDDPIRKEIVSILRGEGYSQTNIAQILRVSDKTIYRIIKATKKDNQISSSPEFVKETVGEMCRLAYQQRLPRKAPDGASFGIISSSLGVLDIYRQLHKR